MYRYIRKTFVADNTGAGEVRFPLPRGGMVMRIWAKGAVSEALSVDVDAQGRGSVQSYHMGNLGFNGSGDDYAQPWFDVIPGELVLTYTGATEGEEYELGIEFGVGGVRHYAVKLKPDGDVMAGSFTNRHGGQFMCLWFEGPAEATIDLELTMTMAQSVPPVTALYDSSPDVNVPAPSQWSTAPPGSYRVESSMANPELDYTVHVFIFSEGVCG